MATKKVHVELIYPDGFTEHVATLDAGWTSGGHLGWAVWLMENEEWLREMEKKHPGLMINTVEEIVT